MRHLHLFAAVAALCCAASLQARDIKIAHVYALVAQSVCEAV